MTNSARLELSWHWANNGVLAHGMSPSHVKKSENPTMQYFSSRAVHTPRPATAGHTLHSRGPGEPAEEDEEGLELPVNPDQGTPLIPDEEGEATAPT